MKFILTPQFREKRVKIAISAILAIGFLYLFSPFIVPILLSLIFAFALEPTVASFTQKKVGRLRITCLTLIFAAILVASAPFAMVAILGYAQLNQMSTEGVAHSRFYYSFQHFREGLVSSLDELAVRFHLESLFKAGPAVDQGVAQVTHYFSNELPILVTSMPFVALSFLVFNITLFLFLFKARSIKAMYLKTHFLPHAELNYMVFSLQASCRATLVSTVLTGLMHACLFSAGSYFFHVGEPVIIFPVTFFCSFLPVIGTLPVTGFLIGASLVAHHPYATIGLFCISALSWTLDYMIRVYWMVNESRRIHPALSFVAILGAIIHFGLAGVIYGPLCISLAAMIIPKFLYVERKRRGRSANHGVLKSRTAIAKATPESVARVPASPNSPAPYHGRPWVN